MQSYQLLLQEYLRPAVKPNDRCQASDKCWIQKYRHWDRGGYTVHLPSNSEFPRDDQVGILFLGGQATLALKKDTVSVADVELRGGLHS